MPRLMWIVILGIVIFLVFLFYYTQKTPQIHRIILKQIHPKSYSIPKQPVSRWVMNSPAPPLPLSTMYAIRIGRNVTASAGPGDEVWDYDHAQITGPKY